MDSTSTIALQEMGIPSHPIHLTPNLCDGQAACDRKEKRNSDWFSLGQGVRQGFILSPSLFKLYAEYNETCYGGLARGLPVGGYNLRYADDTKTSVAQWQTWLSS